MQANHPQNKNFATMIPPRISVVNHVGAGDESKASDIEFLMKFPPGYRFQPTDTEIIIEYLMKKINNEKLPPNLIKTVVLYNFTPDQLAGLAPSGDGESLFFTKREKISERSTRPARVAGDGYWKVTTPKAKITHNGQIIGSRSGLVYFKGKHSASTKTDWLMHEYTATSSSTTQETSTTLDDWVLCRVYKNKRMGYSKRKREHDEEVKDGEVGNEALQLSVESSTAILGPSSSDIDGDALNCPNNLERLSSESNISHDWASQEQTSVGCSSNETLYDEARCEEGIDNFGNKAAKVESSHRISSASSNSFDQFYMPPYQQVPGFASDYHNHLRLQVQQGYNKVNKQLQGSSQLHVEYPNQYSGPSCSSLSEIVSPLLLKYIRQQGSAFTSD